jgi:hypothetical protein
MIHSYWPWWLVADTYERSFLVDLRTPQCLNKYLFERKNNNILGSDSENKYTLKNEDHDSENKYQFLG